MILRKKDLRASEVVLGEVQIYIKKKLKLNKCYSQTSCKASKSVTHVFAEITQLDMQTQITMD